MLTASGRFAKSLLDRRIIYNLNGTVNTPTILRGSVEKAARRLVFDNAVNCFFDPRRNIPILALGELKNLTPIIVDENGQAAEKQVSYQPLMEYTDEILGNDDRPSQVRSAPVKEQRIRVNDKTATGGWW